MRIKLFYGLLICLLIITPVVWHYRQKITRIIKTELLGFKGADKQACSCTWNTLQLKKDSYQTKHRPEAVKSRRNVWIKNEIVLKEQIKRYRLVEIENNTGYRIINLQNSSKHLTPKAYALLIEMGKRFQYQLKDSGEKNGYFEISSVLRTEEQQKRIRILYPNAATINNSTHSYGISFDIFYVQGRNCRMLNKALNEVLNQMQQERKILICPESNCIHITAVYQVWVVRTKR